MATFGDIASPAPNVLFSPMAVDQALQARQQNALMMDMRREDQQFQQQNQQVTMAAAERDHLAREAQALLALPDDQLAAEAPARLQRAQALGFGRNITGPLTRDRLQAFVQAGLTPQQALARADQQKQQGGEWLAGLGIGGGAPAVAAPAAPGAAPAGPAVAGVPAELMPHFEEASRQTGIPVPLLIAQAKQESGFNPNATGSAGEVGIMQIKPSTAQQPGFGLAGVDPASLRDPRANILFGAQYLAARNKGVDWNDPAQRDRGLAVYNGGGDPNYAANVTRNLPGGVAARTGGTDMAGPGVPAADAVNPRSGLTAQQEARIVAMNRSGATQEEVTRVALQMAQTNEVRAAAAGEAARTQANNDRTFNEARRHNQTVEEKGAAAERTAAENTGFTRANTLRDEFTTLTKDYRAVQGAHATLKEAGRDPTPAGDMSLLYQFNKMLDPGSVVRESEFAAAARNGSLGTQMQAQVERLLSGQRLTDEQRKDILGQADRILKAQRRTYDQHRGQYRGLAERYKLDPDAVTPDFTLPDEAPQGGGGGQQRGPGYEDPRTLGLDGMPTVRTPEEAHALPPGTHYLTPDGRTFKR